MTEQSVMEYQKRLKFIDYIKKNFIVQKDEKIVFYYKNYDELDLVTAQKIKCIDENSEYHIGRDELKLGKCILCDTFGDGPYLSFSDEYLEYEEMVALGRCTNNSLSQSVARSKSEIRNEMVDLLKELNGEQPTYSKSNC